MSGGHKHRFSAEFIEQIDAVTMEIHEAYKLIYSRNTSKKAPRREQDWLIENTREQLRRIVRLMSPYQRALLSAFVEESESAAKRGRDFLDETEG